MSHDLCPQTSYRLPTNVVPSFYSITIQTQLDKFKFVGQEEIQVEVKNVTDEIIVNVEDLSIAKAAFVKDSSEELIGKVTIDEVNQKATIKFDDKLHPGNGRLKLDFAGNLNEQMKGFYRCKYKASNGEERFSASTQFETTYARRAFPCWDEPALKARFQLTLIAPKNLTFLSNTDVISETLYEKDANLKKVQFDVTPIMSTYLLAFVVGEYEFINFENEKGVSIKVYTQIGKKDQGTFALNTGIKALSFFENYFNIPYPLKKLDNIAIPDFSLGAMENWGLITYRETAILTDPKNSSSTTQEWVAMVVAHEIAHQWFGNLVTMEWWTDLWLNEGFATFMQFLATDAIFPEFEIWSQFVTSSILVALSLDSFHNTHEIEIPVKHPSEVESIFDAISYEKGGAVIRMCYKWIGDEAFKNGLHNYLTLHAYKNTVTKDLWKALSEASKLPVDLMMSTWTKQKGHPVVQVSARTENGRRILSLTQERYTIDGVLSDSELNTIWKIPLSIVSSQSPQSSILTILMETKSLDITLDNLVPTDWVKINPEMEGFYRVNYSPDMLELLKPGIVEKQLTAIDRLQILNDLFSMAVANKASTVDFLNILSCYKQEDSLVTWNGIDDCIGELNLYLSYTDFQTLLHTFCSNLYSNIFLKMGFDSNPTDKHTDNLLRMTVLRRLAIFGDKRMVNEAKKRFQNHCNGSPIPPDLRTAVYTAISVGGSDEEFEKLFELYHKEDLQEEKMRLATAAGATRDPAKIQRVLEFSFSENVRSQDSLTVMMSTLRSPAGREAAWSFFLANNDEIRRRYEGQITSCQLVESITMGFACEEKAVEVEKFFSLHPFPGAESHVRRGIESIRKNVKWLLRESSAVKQWLSQMVG